MKKKSHQIISKTTYARTWKIRKPLKLTLYRVSFNIQKCLVLSKRIKRRSANFGKFRTTSTLLWWCWKILRYQKLSVWDFFFFINNLSPPIERRKKWFILLPFCARNVNKASFFMWKEINIRNRLAFFKFKLEYNSCVRF